MLIASSAIGDLLLTLTRVTAVKKDDNGEFLIAYHLTFTDMPTMKTYTHVYEGENDAIYAFAGVLVADEEHGGTLHRVLTALGDSPAQSFLP